MNYESYKQFFDGGFFPIDSDHKLVNLENTGEFEVTATTGSGAQTKVEKHYLPSEVGLTNMLRNYTGGSIFEALTQSQGHTFIPELADCTSYTGAQKAIVNHFEQTKKPLIIDLDYSDAAGKSLALTFETDTNRVIEWGDGETYRGVDKAVNHQYAKAGNFKVKIYNWIDGQIKVQKTGAANFVSPILTNFIAVQNASTQLAEFLLYSLHLAKSYPTVIVNANNTYDFSKVFYLEMGVNLDLPVNVYTGLAEWVNLEELAPALNYGTLNCRGLYWDWKPLTFKLPVKLLVYPDEITAKTVIDYFATKATWDTYGGEKGKITLMNEPGAQAIYDWYKENYTEDQIEVTISQYHN